MKKFKIPGFLREYKAQKIKNIFKPFKNIETKFKNALIFIKSKISSVNKRINKVPKATVIAMLVLAVVTFGVTYYSGIIDSFNKNQPSIIEVDIEDTKPGVTTTPSAIPEDPEVVGTPSMPDLKHVQGQSPGQQQLDSQEQKQGQQEQLNNDPIAELAEIAELGMVLPLKGEIVRPFGFNYSKTFKDYRFHDGIDIDAKSGSAIVAVLPGKVVKVNFTEMEKYTITIDHGSYLQTYYKHIGEVKVEKGEQVDKGQTIGVITEPGSWDKETGPHLHFTIEYKGEKIDPGKYNLSFD
jgi:murein DD-endopeptidase MepM/ murein hydrolase activator NlpD